MFSTPRRRGFILFLIGALAFGLLAFTLYVIFTVGDCINPGGDCYGREEARGQRIVHELNAITIAAAECSIRLTTRSALLGKPPDVSNNQIRRCVDRTLARSAR